MSLDVEKKAEAVRVEDYKEWQTRLSKSVVDFTSSSNDDDVDVKHVGGLDTSFHADGTQAVACLVVLELNPSLRVVYEDFERVLFGPEESAYVPGMLGRREVPAYLSLLERFANRRFPDENNNPDFMTTVFMVDGCGKLHPRRFGCACHLAIMWEKRMHPVHPLIRTVGVAKNFLHVGDGMNVRNKDDVSRRLTTEQEKKKSRVFLDITVYDSNTSTETVLGRAVRFASKKPIYVSVGHRMGLDGACDLVNRCCVHRIPEPVRQADLRSRTRACMSGGVKAPFLVRSCDQDVHSSRGIDLEA